MNSPQIQAVVVGYGSIGRRHARILSELGCRVGVVTRSQGSEYRTYFSLEDALAARPDYVVIANETADHHATLDKLATLGFKGDVLIEKPLDSVFRSIPANVFRNCAVAYNLRFHPCIRYMHEVMGGRNLISAQIYVGQFLPDWRPNSDYRMGYSAHISRGGGVLRDLSHEIDYASWLCGRWTKLTAIGGHLSQLEINSDDCWGILAATERCSVLTLQMNYLDRPGQRSLILNTATQTIKCDFGTGVVYVDGVARQFSAGRDDTYRAQHAAALNGRWEELSSVEEAHDVMKIIAAVECSAAEGTWIETDAFAPSVPGEDPRV